MTRRSALLCLVLLLPAAAAHARQAAPPPSGQWIETSPQGGGWVEIDLARKEAEWCGTISIPQQGTKGLPLGEVTVKSPDRHVRNQGFAGDARFLVRCQLTGRRSVAPSRRAADPCRCRWPGRGSRSSRPRRRAPR